MLKSINMRIFICCFLVAVTIGILGGCGADQGDKIVEEQFENGKKIVNETGDPIITFSFFTQQSRVIPYVFNANRNIDIARLPSKNFDPTKLTIFVTHGLIENERYLVCTRLRDAYLKHNVNVIVVTWDGGDFSTPQSIEKQVKFISGKITTMLELLIEKAQLKLSKVILVGFSIGAQIMGITGHKLSVKVDTVIGLDPALYPFSTVDATERLSPSSGDYVQVLHTNSDYYGYRKPLGHADFYLNGGTEQPGCNGDPICSHNRAWEYFAESINNNFLGGNCTSYETLEHDIDTLNCNTYFQRFGGLKPDHSIVGIFNAETNDTAPYFPHWIY